MSKNDVLEKLNIYLGIRGKNNQDVSVSFGYNDAGVPDFSVTPKTASNENTRARVFSGMLVDVPTSINLYDADKKIVATMKPVDHKNDGSGKWVVTINGNSQDIPREPKYLRDVKRGDTTVKVYNEREDFYRVFRTVLNLVNDAFPKFDASNFSGGVIADSTVERITKCFKAGLSLEDTVEITGKPLSTVQKVWDTLK